jgi:hypothetical protein
VLARPTSSAPAVRSSVELARGTVVAKCRIISVPPPLPGGGDGTPSDSVVQVSDFESVEEVWTADGAWDATLALDPDQPQPELAVALEEMPDDPERGVFAGILEMKALLRLVNHDTGETFDSSLSLGFSLAGPWAFASEESPIDSNLVYFTYDEDGPTGPEDPGVVIPDLVKKLRYCTIHLKKSTSIPYSGPMQE